MTSTAAPVVRQDRTSRNARFASAGRQVWACGFRPIRPARWGNADTSSLVMFGTLLISYSILRWRSQHIPESRALSQGSFLIALITSRPPGRRCSMAEMTRLRAKGRRSTTLSNNTACSGRRYHHKATLESLLVNVAVRLVARFFVVVLMVILGRPEHSGFADSGHHPVSFGFELPDQ
jgi:hypothetical protein